MPEGPDAASGGGRVYPWVAVLLAAASVLEPLSWELHEAPLADAVPALLITAAFAVVVWLVAVALRRRADAGAALIACVWVVGSLYYLELVRHLNRALGGDYSMVRPLPVALAVMIALTFALGGARRWHGVVHTVMACIAVALIARPVWVVADFEWRHGAATAAYDADRAMAAMPALAQTGGAEGEAPDIYHVVFDRYGSEETLREHYGVREPIGAVPRIEGLLRRPRQLRQLRQHRAFARLDLRHGLSDRAGGGPAGARSELASALRDDGRQPGRAVPARAGLRDRAVRLVVGRHAPQSERRPQLGAGARRVRHGLRQADDPDADPPPAARYAADHAARLGQRPVPAHRPAGRGDQAHRRRRAPGLRLRAHPGAARAVRLRTGRAAASARRSRRRAASRRATPSRSPTPTPSSRSWWTRCSPRAGGRRWC